MWMMGGPPATGYSCTMANDGDATSCGSAPSAAAMARTRNVLPAPRSPTRCTTASRGSSRAISRPAAAVSASVGAMKCLDRIGQPLRQIVRRQPGATHLVAQQIAGEAVQVDGGARGVERVDLARQESDDDAAEDVAHAAAGHAGISGGVA